MEAFYLLSVTHHKFQAATHFNWCAAGFSADPMTASGTSQIQQRYHTALLSAQIQ